VRRDSESALNVLQNEAHTRSPSALLLPFAALKVQAHLVVISRNSVEPSPNDTIHSIQPFQQLLRLVDSLLGSLEVSEKELSVGDGGEGESVGFGCWRWRSGSRFFGGFVGRRVRVRETRVEGGEKGEGGGGVWEKHGRKRKV